MNTGGAPAGPLFGPPVGCTWGVHLGRAPIAARAALLFAALFQPRSLAGQFAQIVELGSAHLGLPLHFDLLDARRAQQEGPLHADPMRSQPAPREVGVVAALAVADDGPPEFLDPFAVAFLDPQVDAHGVTRPKLGDLGVDGGFDRLAVVAHRNHLACGFRTTAAPPP